MRYLVFTLIAASFTLAYGQESEKESPETPTPVSPEKSTSELVAPPLLQSQVKGLLVITLPNGSHAGTATQMNATAVPLNYPSGFTLRFNQNVGPLMKGASDEVSKFMQVRHAGSLPKGYAIEFGFADKHSLKDGPSAAVACSLMANAIISGKNLDQKFAVTGDMTATGEVRPVGGVGAKIKGALRKDCTVFAVPKANTKAISDLFITDGLEAISKIQIISVGTFDEALQIGAAKKSAEVEAALSEFAQVQKAISNNKKNAGHPKVVAKLRAILKAIPGHESARIIALYGQNRAPSKLSLGGSLKAIESGAEEFAKLLSVGNIRSTQGFDDPLRDTISNLNRIEKNIDQRTKGLLRAYIKLAYFFKERRERKTLSNNEHQILKGFLGDLETQRDQLRNDKTIQEELLDD